MNTSYEHILLQMINAAIAAGRAILTVKHSDSYAIHSKSDSSPVTDADYASQNVISETLSSLHIPTISEESTADSYEVRKDWDMVMIIDPLDGTKEFINGSDQYGVNIALCHNGAPVIGVIFIPERGTLYFGTTDIPATKAQIEPHINGFDSLSQIEGTRLPLPREGHRPYICLASKSSRSIATIQYYEQLKASIPDVEIIPMGSCVKYCAIAEDAADEYTRFGNVMEWDTAAGDAILRSLGMPICDIHTGAPLQYNKEILHSSDFTVKRHRE